MSELSQLLDQIRVRATVADGAITGELHDHDQIDLSFAPKFYQRSTERALQQNLVSLARLMYAGYIREYYVALSTVFRRTITAEPPSLGRDGKEYAARREELVAAGHSGDGRITITVRGMQSWTVHIAADTIHTLDEHQFADEVGQAATALIRDQFAGIRTLKTRIFK